MTHAGEPTARAAAAHHPGARLLHAALALLLAGAWLAVGARPAAAAVEWGVQSPGAGATVDGAFTLNAYVDSFADEAAQTVRARFRRGDQPVGEVLSLSQQGGGEATRLPGVQRTTWRTVANPGGMLNGTYVLEVSVTNSRYPEGSPWQGHEIVVDVAPTAKLETVRVANAAERHVEVRWQRSSAPDFRRYVLQRAAGGGSFQDVATVATSDTSTHVDTVPDYGEYRYRVKVVRSNASGGEHEAVSEPRTVSVEPDASERPETGNRPPGERTPVTATPPEGGAAPPPRPSTPPPASGGQGGGATARPPRSRAAAPPGANQTFEEFLDYGELPDFTQEQPQPQVAEGAGIEDGTLQVFGDGESDPDRALVPIAAGLVFTLGGLHILRFLRSGA